MLCAVLQRRSAPAAFEEKSATQNGEVRMQQKKRGLKTAAAAAAAMRNGRSNRNAAGKRVSQANLVSSYWGKW